jgi:murein L,D-transpeptidase YafK
MPAVSLRYLAGALIAAALLAAAATPAMAGKAYAMVSSKSGVNGQISLPKADRVVVLKGERKLVLMRGDQVLKVYRVALGRYAKGAKTRLGDAKTPEGSYTLDYRLSKSAFHRAIHISYPNARDRALARSQGVEPGGKIMIHGLAKNWTADDLNHPNLDWTQGCIAVTNREIEEIWRLVSDGTPIDIHP